MATLQKFKLRQLIKRLTDEFNIRHDEINSECLSLQNTFEDITKLYKEVPYMEFDNPSEVTQILSKTNGLYKNKINDLKNLNKEMEHYLQAQYVLLENNK